MPALRRTGWTVLSICLDQIPASRRLDCNLLGFDEDVYQAVRLLAAKWCAEPSVHGGKRRPKGAMLVV